MTKEQFIDLLERQWPDVRIQLRGGPLYRICANLAGDAFLRKMDENAATQELRRQLLHLDETGTFDFGEEEHGGWYLARAEIEQYSTDLLRLTATVRHPDPEFDDEQIEEFLDPDVDGKICGCRVEEYGGEGRSQQSIVVIAEVDQFGDDFEMCVQVEISPESGRFKEESLHGWERA